MTVIRYFDIASIIIMSLSLVAVFLRYFEVYLTFSRQMVEKHKGLSRRDVLKLAMLMSSVPLISSIIVLCLFTESFLIVDPVFLFTEITRQGLSGIVILIMGGIMIHTLIQTAIVWKILKLGKSYVDLIPLSLKFSLKPLKDFIWIPVILVMYMHFYPLHLVISDLINSFFMVIDLSVAFSVILIFTGIILTLVLFKDVDYGYYIIVFFVLIPLFWCYLL